MQTEATNTTVAHLPTDAAAYMGDVSEDLARRAYEGTSFVPERRAASNVREYAETLAAMFRDLSKHANTDEKRATLAAEFARFREGFRRRFVAYLASRGRVVSWFIAGPSNFPAARMEKRHNIAHRRLSEALDFQKRAKDAILRTLHPEARPIMSGDANAIERLTAEIEKAEALQERMKAANKAMRANWKKGPEAVVLAVMETGFSEALARKVILPDFCGRTGFADFELTNNGANIRRMKKRLAAIECAHATPDSQVNGELGRVEVCPAENRVRVFFADKPAADLRAKMKAAGFRWTPSLEAWQAYVHPHTVAAARDFAGVPADAVAETAAAQPSLLVA